MLKTCEFVTPKHPDKICDYIADSILDAHLHKDPNSRVAVEVMGGHGLITLNGEVTSTSKINYSKIVKQIVGKDYKILVNIAKQSPLIAQGVDTGGAGDQGIMTGYAFAKTKSLMPLEYELARNLCQKIYKVYPFDGKVQVTIQETASRSMQVRPKVLSVVASFQNSKNEDLLKLVKKIIKAEEYLINPAGEWNLGGFDADSGLSGRKIVVDNYGPEYSVGGGSFSGKDPTKVDRSGAYMTRKIAVDYLKKYKAQKVGVKLAYAIGKKNPVMAVANVDGKEIKIKDYDLTPAGIRKLLKLSNPIYTQTGEWGHFGRRFAWDK